MAIGQDLLDVPFSEMVHALAKGVADAQADLDRNAVDTARFLAEQQVDLITDIEEIISSSPEPVLGPDGQPLRDANDNVVTYPRVSVSTRPKMARSSLLQAGITPTFYQFTEAAIDVKMAITLRRDSQSTTGGRSSTALTAFASTVDFRSSNSYSYSAQGASSLRAVLKPVPAPARLTPRVVTVDATNPNATPTVTVTG